MLKKEVVITAMPLEPLRRGYPAVIRGGGGVPSHHAGAVGGSAVPHGSDLRNPKHHLPPAGGGGA